MTEAAAENWVQNVRPQPWPGRKVEAEHFKRSAADAWRLVESKDQRAAADAVAELEVIAEVALYFEHMLQAREELRHLGNAGQGGVIDGIASEALAGLDPLPSFISTIRTEE